MKRNILHFIILTFFVYSCNQGKYVAVEIENPVFRENTAFLSAEDLTLDKFDALKQKYQLDTVIRGETDELKRILLLRHWIKKVITIEDFKDSYSGEGYPERILDAALGGEGFHCGHFMVVQNAIMNAYGYVTRCIGAGPGQPGFPDGHHGINEIWLNDYNKWFLSDAKYDHHFEKDGIPLSALEVREEFLKNEAKDIVMVKGPERTPIAFDPEMERTKESFARTYTWIEWDTYADRYSSWPDFRTMLNMYEDTYFKNHTWIWDGKPHWAYGTEYMRLIDNKDAIEWTPNTIGAEVQIEGDITKISLHSDTPNLKAYQMKTSPSGQWQKVDEQLTIPLTEEKHELIFRTLNLAGVSGPEYTILLKKEY